MRHSELSAPINPTERKYYSRSVRLIGQFASLWESRAGLPQRAAPAAPWTVTETGYDPIYSLQISKNSTTTTTSTTPASTSSGPLASQRPPAAFRVKYKCARYVISTRGAGARRPRESSRIQRSSRLNLADWTSSDGAVKQMADKSHQYVFGSDTHRALLPRDSCVLPATARSRRSDRARGGRQRRAPAPAGFYRRAFIAISRLWKSTPDCRDSRPLNLQWTWRRVVGRSKIAARATATRRRPVVFKIGSNEIHFIIDG
ncbi:hypothetical protein EVAR_94432_1 [Eumeta japonica]|uniref:Uncharacterized protein n=1 Tax=Eumeta variegata TaxID=151549 RepID=A0A4C1TQ63_EUMVA|nr:hypothetical protein EVAR_94432_1 [Eumeta japonica]